MSLSERVELPQQVPVAAALFHEQREGVQVTRAGRLLGTRSCHHLPERTILHVHAAECELVHLVLHAEHA